MSVTSDPPRRYVVVVKKHKAMINLGEFHTDSLIRARQHVIKADRQCTVDAKLHRTIIDTETGQTA